MLFSCDECPKIFWSYSAKYYHTKKVHEGIIYRCEKCNHISTYPSGLSNHIAAKHAGIVYKCNECEKVYAYKTDLTVHKKYKHSKVMSSSQCDKCDFNYRKLSELNVHVKVVHEGYRYECRECDSKFTRARSLKTHVKIRHENHLEKIFPCEFCNFMAKQKQTLKLHTIKHHVKTVYAEKNVDIELNAATEHIGEPDSEDIKKYGRGAAADDDSREKPVFVSNFACNLTWRES